MRRLHASGKVIPIYLDLQDLASSPELFAQRYVGLSCFWAVEVKWRQKRVGRGELEHLLAAPTGPGARAWCVSLFISHRCQPTRLYPELTPQ